MEDLKIDYDYIYDLAFKYKETRLWKKISAHMPLALELEDGNIAHICVVGQMGEYNAVVVGLNDEGYYFLDKLLKNELLLNEYVKFANIFEGNFIQMALGKKSYLNKEELERVSAYKKKNNLKLKGPNTFPFFRKSREFGQSVELKDEEGFNILSQVLKALISLGSMLKEKNRRELKIGYLHEFDKIPLMKKQNGTYIISDYIERDQNVKISYPEAKVINIDTIRKLKEIPKNIVFNLKLIPIYNPEIDKGHLYIPLILAPFVDGLDLMLTLDVTESPDDYPDKIVNDFLQVLVEEKTNPALINVFDKRTFDLFKNICSVLDIGIKLIDENQQVKDFEQGLNSEKLATYFDDEEISLYAFDLVAQSMLKIDNPDSIEKSYSEILENLEFILCYSQMPYVEIDENIILSIKEAIKDLENIVNIQ